jgi:hypothetical protein
MTIHPQHLHHLMQRWSQRHPGEAFPMPRGPGHRSATPTFFSHEIPGLPGYEEMVDRYSVTNEKWEVIRAALYDSAVYPAAGTPSLLFFTVQKGQGIGFGGTAKTLSDTNMTLSGQIPTNQSFLIKTVEIEFQPTTPSVTAQLPAVFGAQAAANIVNDVYVFRRSGNFTLLIGAKNYIEEAPLGKFPSQTTFHVEAALSDATTPGAAFQSRIAFANMHGRPYHISPADLRLEQNMNFSVALNWNEGLQALPSGNPARVFVRLDGLLYRRSQ